MSSLNRQKILSSGSASTLFGKSSMLDFATKESRTVSPQAHAHRKFEIVSRGVIPTTGEPSRNIREASTTDSPLAEGVKRNYLIAEWHGQVLSVQDDYFIAELSGTVGEGVRDSHEEAQIPLEEISESDRELLVTGAFFRLCISYELDGQTRRKFTQVIFRRLPAYRRDDLEHAKDRAAELKRALRVE